MCRPRASWSSIHWRRCAASEYDPPVMADHESQKLWINGERAPARSGRFAPVLEPATGEALAQVAQAGPEDVDAAVAAARGSWEKGEWRRASSERAKVLLKLAERIRGAAEELARL